MNGSENRTDEKREDYRKVTSLMVVDEAKKLDDRLSSVLVEVFSRGAVTPSKISEELDLPESEVNERVKELKLHGYLESEVEESEEKIRISEYWEADDFPTGPVIPLVYQYNLLSDSSRLNSINEAINEEVEQGDTVVDLGAGSGILSYISSKKAEKVYAVEIDRDVHDRGKEILKSQGVENVEYLKRDARMVDMSDIDVDVVICEMLDTALVAEPQIPVMNNAVEKVLSSDGATIPHSCKTTATLVYTDYEFFGGEFRLPHYEEYGSRESKNMSDEIEYHEIEFGEMNDRQVREVLSVETTNSGKMNGVQLNTYVKFGEKTGYTGPSSWLNPPLVIPADETYDVDEGDTFTIDIGYNMGAGLSDLACSIRPGDR
jgi:predicted RNA methylase